MGSRASKLLEEAQKNHSKDVNLKETNLKSLPIVVCTNFNYIVKLNLNDNLIKEIPPDIYKMRSLKILWMSNNKLVSIADEVGLLSELEELHVDGNSISRIGKVFFELKKIRDLSLARNALKEVPSDMGMLTSLKTLSLENNELIALPGCLGALANLRTLNAGQNQIEYLYGDVVNMASLTNLSLFGNRLHTLPETFGRLGALSNLNLRSNTLSTLPGTFSSLQSLTTLSLWDNSFSVFPESLCRVTSLTELSFSNNRLETLPPSIKSLVNLRKLYLQYNQIESIPTEIKYLVSLNHLLLHHNKLLSVPCEISGIRALDSINLTGNPLHARLLQLDMQALMKHLHGEMSNKRDVSARVIQRHYRAFKKQYRFRCVVFAVLEEHRQHKNIQMTNTSILLIKAATKIQRWFRSRKRLSLWHQMVSKLILINSIQQNIKLRSKSTDSTNDQSSSTQDNHGNNGLMIASSTINITGTRSGRLGSIFGFDEPDHEDNIIYYVPESQSSVIDGLVNPATPIIKAATVPKLIEHLCYITYNEPGFTRAFFATYTSFIEPTELFQLLCVRYHVEPPVNGNDGELDQFRKIVKPRIQERVIELLGYWIKHHLNDFEVHPKLLKNFNSFLSNTLLFEKETSAKRLIAIFNETKKKNRDDLEELLKLAQNAPKPILPLKPMDGTSISLLDLSTIEVARQMALIDQSLLARISAKELLSKKWSSQHVGNIETCPNIINMIQVFNNGSQWVASEIVQERSSKQRLKRLKFFLDVARHCFEMNNYNGLMMVVSGLSSSSVGRLKGTWGSLSSRRREQFEEMERFVNMEGNFKLYRLVLSDVVGPCLPFVGLYLMDLTFMDEGNPTYIGPSGKLLNFVKKRMEANSINRFLSYRGTQYCFEPVPFIQDMVLSSPTLTEKELYDRSVAIEKRHLRKISKRQSRERMLTHSNSNVDLAESFNQHQQQQQTSTSTNTPSKSSIKKEKEKEKEREKSAAKKEKKLQQQQQQNNTNNNMSTPPPKLKKGDQANTSSPAIMSSPPKEGVPKLEFTLSSNRFTPISQFNSLYHSVDNSPMSSPRFVTNNNNNNPKDQQKDSSSKQPYDHSPNSSTFSTIRSTSSYLASTSPPQSPPSTPRGGDNSSSNYKYPNSPL